MRPARWGDILENAAKGGVEQHFLATPIINDKATYASCILGAGLGTLVVWIYNARVRDRIQRAVANENGSFNVHHEDEKKDAGIFSRRSETRVASACGCERHAHLFVRTRHRSHPAQQSAECTCPGHVDGR